MTGREWEPGDVVKVGNEIAMRVATGEISASPAFIFASGDEWQNVIARPLVVIDPEDREQIERLLWHWRSAFMWTSGPTEGDTDCAQAALREFANPTPIKPDEPTGLGAVVVDADGETWVRDVRDEWCPSWLCSRRGASPRRHRWSEIAAVKVLSEGVTA